MATIDPFEKSKQFSDAHHKLKKDVAKALRILHRNYNISLRDLGDIFGCSNTTIKKIIDKKLWS